MRISDWSSDVCSSDLRGIGEHDDIGQAGVVEHLDRDRRARHLHQAEDTLLHPRAAAGGEDDIGAFVGDRGFYAGDERLADREPHRSAHEREILDADDRLAALDRRSEEHTSELQSLMRISYAVFCLTKKKKKYKDT